MKDLISIVPANCLPELERYFKGIVAEIHTKIIKVDTSRAIESQSRRWRESMTIATDRTLKRICDGMPRLEALEMAATEPPYPPFATIEIWLRYAERAKAKADRAKRNDLIRKLVAKGLSNAAIARKIGVSTSTVAKAARRQPA